MNQYSDIKSYHVLSPKKLKKAKTQLKPLKPSLKALRGMGMSRFNTIAFKQQDEIEQEGRFDTRKAKKPSYTSL